MGGVAGQMRGGSTQRAGAACVGAQEWGAQNQVAKGGNRISVMWAALGAGARSAVRPPSVKCHILVAPAEATENGKRCSSANR
eukprot:5961014-Pyramimonas_sp.AAC.1